MYMLLQEVYNYNHVFSGPCRYRVGEELSLKRNFTRTRYILFQTALFILHEEVKCPSY